MSKAGVFNELGGVEYGLWCDLSAGIDPTQWASLCRWLGHLEAGEFDDLLVRLRRRRLIGGAKRLAEAIMAAPDKADEQRPLISLGPSGLGGQYQKELKARSCGAQRQRQRCSGPGMSVDFRA